MANLPENSVHWIWWLEQVPDLKGALCAEPGMDPDAWFSDDETIIDQVISICNICPVRQKCLDSSYEEDVATNAPPYGVRGGLREEERRGNLGRQI